MCATMREKLSRQMFEVVIQAAANGKIIARETLKVCLRPCHCLLQWSIVVYGIASWTQPSYARRSSCF